MSLGQAICKDLESRVAGKRWRLECLWRGAVVPSLFKKEAMKLACLGAERTEGRRDGIELDLTNGRGRRRGWIAVQQVV